LRENGQITKNHALEVQKIPQKLLQRFQGCLNDGEEGEDGKDETDMKFLKSVSIIFLTDARTVDYGSSTKLVFLPYTPILLMILKNLNFYLNI